MIGSKERSSFNIRLIALKTNAISAVERMAYAPAYTGRVIQA
jgi:hypothetical protein